MMETIALTCTMERDCTGPVSYVDNKGYVYCALHGPMRRVYRPCRKLLVRELAALRRGETISYTPKREQEDSI